MVDWLHPAVVHCVWDRLRTIEGAWACLEPRDAARTCAYICMLCRTLRGSLLTFVRDLGRTYLLCVPDMRFLTCKTVAMELAMRRFVHRVYEASRGHFSVTVAGGFAAWQLDRHVEAMMGRDAFPSADADGVWIPDDIDVYVSSSDVMKVDELMSVPILQLMRDLAPTRDFKLWFKASKFNEYNGETGRSRRITDPVDFVDKCVRERGFRSKFTDPFVARVTRDVQPRGETTHGSIVAFASRTGSDALEAIPMGLSSVNLVYTTAPPAGVAYAEWIASRFDLQHCAITLSVDGDTGRWVFGGTPGAREALARRSLRFGAHAFQNEYEGLCTVERVLKYINRGFDFRDE